MITGPIQGKTWGMTQQIFHLNNVEMHYIDIVRGGYSSMHKHNGKYNRFIVISGTLKVIQVLDGKEDDTILTPGMMTDIAPGVYHKFVAMEDTHAIEIYWTVIQPDDIVRLDRGGVYDETMLSTS